jgi:hypothetical protein
MVWQTEAKELVIRINIRSVVPLESITLNISDAKLKK